MYLYIQIKYSNSNKTATKNKQKNTRTNKNEKNMDDNSYFVLPFIQYIFFKPFLFQNKPKTNNKQKKPKPTNQPIAHTVFVVIDSLNAFSSISAKCVSYSCHAAKSDHAHTRTELERPSWAWRRDVSADGRTVRFFPL